MAFGAVFPPTGAILGSLTDTGTNTVFGGAVNFANRNIGAAAATRVVVVVVVGLAAAGATTVAIGGTNAPQQISKQTGNQYAQVYSAVIPSGTTADVLVSGQSTSALNIAVYALYNTNGATAFGTNSSAVDPSSLNLTAAGGGFTVGGMSTAGGTSSSWSGLTADFDVNNAGSRLTSASGGNASGGTLTISCNQPSGTNPAAVSATWSPG